MLDAGKLNTRIRIQTPVDQHQAAGGTLIKWADQWERWAQVITMAGREPRVAGALMPQHSHVVRMRYLPELSTRHRITWKDKVLEIVGVADKDSQHDETIAECNEVENG